MFADEFLGFEGTGKAKQERKGASNRRAAAREEGSSPTGQGGDERHYNSLKEQSLCSPHTEVSALTALFFPPILVNSNPLSQTLTSNPHFV